jgi:preprotein translocase subunit SecE
LSLQNVRDTMDLKEKIEKIKEYFKEVYLETKRVTWPSRKDTLKGTYVILITVVVAATFLGIVDITVGKLIRALLGG